MRISEDFWVSKPAIVGGVLRKLWKSDRAFQRNKAWSLEKFFICSMSFSGEPFRRKILWQKHIKMSRSHPTIKRSQTAISAYKTEGQFFVFQFLSHPAFCLEKFFSRSSFCFHIFWNFLVFSLSEIKIVAIKHQQKRRGDSALLGGVASRNNNYQNYFFVEQSA